MVVQRITEPGLVDAIFRLRLEAWATEGVSFPEAPDGKVFDRTDAEGEHYGIVDNGNVVAAVRLSHHADVSELAVPDGSWCASFKYPVASLSRLVVHPNFRRRGYGSSLATHIAREAMRSRARTHIAYVNAPIVHRVLRELGFSSAGQIKYPWGDQALDTALLVRSAVAGQTAAG